VKWQADISQDQQSVCAAMLDHMHLPGLSSKACHMSFMRYSITTVEHGDWEQLLKFCYILGCAARTGHFSCVQAYILNDTMLVT